LLDRLFQRRGVPDQTRLPLYYPRLHPARCGRVSSSLTTLSSPSLTLLSILKKSSKIYSGKLFPAESYLKSQNQQIMFLSDRAPPQNDDYRYYQEKEEISCTMDDREELYRTTLANSEYLKMVQLANLKEISTRQKLFIIENSDH